MFSTVKNIVCGVETDSIRTTMESNSLQSLLRKSNLCNEEISVVEVSSHALTLKRVEQINWDIGVFTSFSRDHLDLYGSMEKYFEAKLDFFRALNNSTKENKIAVINIDDVKGEEVCSVLDKSVKLIRVGTSTRSDYQIMEYKVLETGMNIAIKNNEKIFHFTTKMRGIFNVGNISLAIAVAMESGLSAENVKKVLDDFSGVDGRFEVVKDKPYLVIVDYAHTPDSLEKILTEARGLSKARVIVVFGCTGDRDREKRSIMGEIAGKLADYTIVTNDDTYTEDPVFIAKSVEAGLLTSGKKLKNDYKIILDRKDAIYESLNIAEKGDVVVIAGMGHEKFQIINNVSVPFSDKDTVLKYFI